MLGSANKNETRSSADWYGRRTKCELCGEEKLCTEHYEIVTCHDCGSTLLPRKALP